MLGIVLLAMIALPSVLVVVLMVVPTTPDTRKRMSKQEYEHHLLIQRIIKLEKELGFNSFYNEERPAMIEWED